MERLKKKKIKGQCDTQFIRMYLIYDLTSNFVRFKLSNLNHIKSSKIKKFQRQLLTAGYREKQKQKLEKDIDQCKIDFFNVYNSYYTRKLNQHFNNIEKKERERIKEKHEIKLSKMLGAVRDHTRSSLLIVDKLMYNLSSKILTTSQNAGLSRGWKFCIERKLIDPLNIQTEKEHNINTLKKEMENKKK